MERLASCTRLSKKELAVDGVQKIERKEIKFENMKFNMRAIWPSVQLLGCQFPTSLHLRDSLNICSRAPGDQCRLRIRPATSDA